MTTLNEYYDELEQHDWFFEYSDDNRVWRAGVNNRNKLIEMSKESEEHKTLYDGFYRFHFSGPSFGTIKNIKPKRPE